MPVLATSAGLISKPVNWIGDPNTALFALTVPYIWRTLPFEVLLVHAALQGINPELFEAASNCPVMRTRFPALRTLPSST